MLFAADLAVPALPTQAAPVEVDLVLPPGAITKVECEFPAGCVGLVFTHCRRGASVIFPTGGAQPLHSDDRVVAWAEDYPLTDAPFTLRLVGWSDDDTFPHTVKWRFELRRFAPGLEQQLVAEALAQGCEVRQVPTAAELIGGLGA